MEKSGGKNVKEEIAKVHPKDVLHHGMEQRGVGFGNCGAPVYEECNLKTGLCKSHDEVESK